MMEPCIHSMLVDDCASCWHGAYSRAVKRMAELREALNEAIGDVESWGAYAGDYFKEKWDLEGDIANLQAVLDKDIGVSW